MIASSLRIFLLAALVSLSVMSVDVHAASRGLAWGTDNRWAKNIAKGSVDWYMHWQNAAVPEMPNDVEYVPMYWGPKYKSLWNQRKKHFKKKMPKYVLAFNEPDVKGQADMSPKQAASLFMKELEPLRKKGVKVSSPQIVWNTKWMDSFLKHLRAKGGDVDFMAVHYYGSWKNVGRLQKWMKTVHKKYHKNIWLTEYGATASSGGSAKQIASFQHRATSWMDKQDYIKRVAWLGCFAVNNPPDAYASRYNAMLSSKGKMRSIGYQFVYKGKHSKRDEVASEDHLAARATPGAKRHALQHHRRIIGLQQASQLAARNESASAVPTDINGFPASPEEIQDYLNHVGDDDDEDDTPDAPEDGDDECDEFCKLREGETEGTELDEEDLKA